VNYAKKIMAESGAQDYNAAFHGLKQKEEKRPCQPRSRPKSVDITPFPRAALRLPWAVIGEAFSLGYRPRYR